MRFWALLVLTAGCSATVRDVRVALQLTGPAAGPAEQQRCLAAATRAGAVVDTNAPVQALVTLDQDGGRVQVVTLRRGLVRDDKRAPASVETLCQDAVAAAAAAREPAALDAPTGAMPAAEPTPSPATSGGVYRGPISDH